MKMMTKIANDDVDDANNDNDTNDDDYDGDN